MQNIYNLPNAPRSMGGLQWQALFIGLVILFFGNIAATQYMAYGFRYQEALGYPAAAISGHGLYAPYMWVVWFLKFNQVQNAEVKHVLWMGLTIAAGGAGVSVLTAALVMFLRTRKLQKGNEHLHGSARCKRPANPILDRPRRRCFTLRRWPRRRAASGAAAAPRCGCSDAWAVVSGHP